MLSGELSGTRTSAEGELRPERQHVGSDNANVTARVAQPAPCTGSAGTGVNGIATAKTGIVEAHTFPAEARVHRIPGERGIDTSIDDEVGAGRVVTIFEPAKIDARRARARADPQPSCDRALRPHTRLVAYVRNLEMRIDLPVRRE